MKQGLHLAQPLEAPFTLGHAAKHSSHAVENVQTIPTSPLAPHCAHFRNTYPQKHSHPQQETLWLSLFYLDAAFEAARPPSSPSPCNPLHLLPRQGLQLCKSE